jgi:hypothetical protein
VLALVLALLLLVFAGLKLFIAGYINISSYVYVCVLHQAVIKMMQHKAKYGKWNHHKARLGNKTIDELFGDPELFIINMETSPWVVAGDPTHSAVMDYLTTFDGPMYVYCTCNCLESKCIFGVFFKKYRAQFRRRFFEQSKHMLKG